jgi:uncharacterized protein (DUF2141 family)
MITLTIIAQLLAFIVQPNAIAELGTSTLTIEVTGLAPSKGNIILSLYNKAEGFPESAEATYQTASMPVKAGKVNIPLLKIPNGTYAVAFFHDANGNGKMDYNFLGLPKEGYGFSNDAMGKFGPPSFKDASFIYTGKEKITMKAKYL